MTIMLTAGERQELRQIEQELRDSDRGFAWRLTVLQGILRRSVPRRRVYLLVLAVLAATLVRFATAAGRLLMACAEGAAALMILGGAAWPGWEPGQAPGHIAGPARDRPQPDDTDQP